MNSARATVVPSSTNKEDCTIPEASSTAAGGCTERVVCSTDCPKELLETYAENQDAIAH